MGVWTVRLVVAVCTLVAGCTAAAPTATAPSATAPTTTARPTTAPTVAPTSAPTALASPSAAPSPTAAPTAMASGPTGTDSPVAEGTILIADGAAPFHLLAGDDALWGVGERSGTREIVKIDPGNNAIVTVVEGLPILPNPVHGMAVNGSIWITSWDRSVATEYDAVTGEQLSEHSVGLHPMEPVYAFDDLWTLNFHGGSVSRIDTEEGVVEATIQLGSPSSPRAAHAGGGLLWVVDVETPTVSGIDPATNTVTRTIDTGIDCLDGVAYVAERLAVAPCSGGAPQLFDPQSGENMGAFDEPAILAVPLEVEGRLWVPRASGGDHIESLVALDPDSLDIVDEFDLGRRFTEWSHAVAFESIWVGGREGVLRIPAESLPRP